MSDALHWSAAYLGRPWVSGEHDCWGFFRAVQEERFGRAIPAVSVDAESAAACVEAIATLQAPRAGWRPLADGDAPEEGDAVLLARKAAAAHVGVWIAADGGGVLHCQRGAGVLFLPRRSLARAGWGRIELFRWVGTP
ncbi:MAG: NlpC/P60 family protein [Anaerolineae bacterium]